MTSSTGNALLAAAGWSLVAAESNATSATLAEEGICVDSPAPVQPFFLCEPPEEVRLVICLFCSSIAIGLLVHHSKALRFYETLLTANVPPSGRRGLGYTACRAYGILPIPHLSMLGFRVAFAGLVAALVLACDTRLAPRFFLFAAMGLYFLYFGQLFCESKHGGHGAILLPSVLLLLALSGGPQGSPWSLVFVKVFLGLVYLAGAISKLAVAGKVGQRWCGSTLQAYIYDAMWSRPHPSRMVRSLQKSILERWWACSLMAVSAIVFEILFLPAMLVDAPRVKIAAAAIAISFHIGVDVLQGLDFKPFWCPVFWVFLSDIRSAFYPDDFGVETVGMILMRGFEEEPLRCWMSAAYLLAQVIVMLSFTDIRGRDILPLTCCPMFAMPRNIFGKEMRGGLLTDADLRAGGDIDMAYNFFPWQEDLPMKEEDLRRLPERALCFLNPQHCHPGLAKRLQAEFVGEAELLLCANFPIVPALRSALQELDSFLESCVPSDWCRQDKVARAVELQELCISLFESSGCKARSRDFGEVASFTGEVEGSEPFLAKPVPNALVRIAKMAALAVRDIVAGS